MAAQNSEFIWRIELWHAALLIALLAVLAPARLIEPASMVLGGLFMGVNFLLLCYGVKWVLMPLAGKGKVKAGVGLLVVKVVLFLGLLSLLFFQFGMDALSFALGFSTLLFAILIEAVRMDLRLRT
jgi:hypothetical protein